MIADTIMRKETPQEWRHRRRCRDYFSARPALLVPLCLLVLVPVLRDGGGPASLVRAEEAPSSSSSGDGECSAGGGGAGSSSAGDGTCRPEPSSNADSSPSSSSSSSSSSVPEEEEEDRQTCGLYLAESSIPNAGLALYTSKARRAGSDVSFVSDPCMAISDMERDTVIVDYEWDAGTMGTESEASHAVSLCPGYGMALNGHMHLHNVQLSFPETDNGIGLDLHRSKDPGVGAFSRYHGVKGTARVDIPAGSELFLNYGESYFKDRTDILGEMPFEEDFNQNDRISSKFAAFLDLHPDLTDSQSAGALSMLRDAMSGALGLSKVVGILPRTVDEALDFARAGTARSMLPESLRTVEWLERNGICADNLIEGTSGIPQAGRGAFAVRRIAKGTVVAPAPVLYFSDASSVFDVSYADAARGPGRQLMLNYCYGHPETTAVLFPYSPVVNYINHAHDPSDVNAEVRWSDSSPHHDRRGLLRKSLDNMTDDTGGGLVMEYVATRDIRPGEEVLIDYGPEWRKAWKEHVDGWTPPPPPSEGEDEDEDRFPYIPAVEWNDRTKHSDLRDWAVIRTLEEEEDEVTYPEYLVTACYVAYFRDYADYDDVGEDANKVIELNWADEEYMWKGHHYLRPCDILERDLVEEEEEDEEEHEEDEGRPEEEERYVYTVQIYNLPGTVDAEKVRDFEDVIVTGVPRRAIKFMDDLYTSDQHLEGAFRHVIGLPDEMVPDTWRNKKASA